MKLGIENFLQSIKKFPLKNLKNKRFGLILNPASLDQNFKSSFELLDRHPDIHLTALFGPQHGVYGEKQDNMVESESFIDSKQNRPVFSLYDKNTRRLTAQMKEHFDVLLFDLQDIGTRVYTYLTTLFYLLEDLSNTNKVLWIFDRPNPIGRFIEGFRLNKNYSSFVGHSDLPLRHGMTLGEIALWYKKKKNLKIRLKVWWMKNYNLNTSPGFGWPQKKLAWINPSPNIPRLSSARAFSGTVLLEGTNLSEGRGTTRPLEVFGAPDIDANKILNKMHSLGNSFLKGCRIRPFFFEPTFHKHKGCLCSALQIHTDFPFYNPGLFKPFRLVSLYLKSLRTLYPDYDLWRPPPYEYEEKLMPIDLITGSSELREWVDDPGSNIDELDRKLIENERSWEEERGEFFHYF